jgi:cysteine-rich repeat protein
MRRGLALSLLCFAIACGDDEPTESLDSGTATPADGGVVDDGGVVRDGGGVALGRVELSSDTLDLGAVVVTSTAMASLTITNTGDEPVQVTISETFGPDAARFKRSLNTPDDNGTFNIEPQGVVTLTVSVSPADFGPLLAVIALDSCAGTCPSAIVLQAIGVETGIYCPDFTQFGVVNPGNCTSFDIVCENRGNAEERITVAELEPTSSPAFTLTEPALPADLGPGDILTIPVEFCPKSTAAYDGTILVATFRPFATERTIVIAGVGGGADVSCTPEQLSFGTVGVSAVISQNIACENRGNEVATLALSLADGTNYNLPEGRVDIAPNATAQLVVEATPQITGTLTDTLVINTNDPDSPLIEVPLTLDSITADPCTASLEPASRDFGLVGIGEARRARLTVTNLGISVCLVRATVMVAGSSPAMRVVSAPAAGTPIQAGETFDVEVELSPTMNAAASGTLSVSFSNPGTTELTAALEGVGGLAPVRVTPSFIDFGESPMGCAAPFTIGVDLTRMLAGAGPISSVTVVNESTAGAFSVNAASLPQTIGLGESFHFDVSFTPSSVAVFTAELSILAGGLPTPIRVPLRGEGVSARTRTQTYAFDAPRTDVLFVIDSSESMEAAQIALATAMNTFDEVLGLRQADYHFGVISTDMEDAAFSGRLQGVPAYQETRDVADLVARAQVGSEGADEGRAFDALQAALTEPLASAENAGFRRPDAALAVIFVGDEDDQSTSAPSISQRVLELRALAGNNPLHVAAIAGPSSAGCVGRYGAADASSRYSQLVLRAGGSMYSFCSDMTENVRAIADQIFGAAVFPLALEPRVSSIEVSVNSASVSGWSFDLATRSVFFPDPSAVPAGASVEVTYAPFCLSATCGNGTTDLDEECDDNNADDDDACTSRCLNARCGDGLSQTGTEECDDANLDNTDDCVGTCIAASCGDGYLRVGVEECDDNNAIGGDGCPAACRFYVASGPVARNYTPLTTPTALTFSGGQDPDDDGVATIALPFTFSYYDVPTTSITVSINGLAGVQNIPIGESYTNVTFPDDAEPNGIMAAWWDDLYFDPGIAQAAIAYEVQGVAPDRTVVIEWRRLRLQDHSTNNHRRFTFQLRLEETTNIIRMRYEETETAGNPPTATTASIGLEDHFGVNGLDPALCSPDCNGQPRPQNPNGFPEQTEIVFTP